MRILIVDDEEVLRDVLEAVLRREGFDGWISIEDGENGMDELRESAAFLRSKIAEHFAA